MLLLNSPWKVSYALKQTHRPDDRATQETAGRAVERITQADAKRAIAGLEICN